MPVVIPGYTNGMKTAISLPDDTFARVSQRAEDLGMSRSEFFARAARHYLEVLDAQSLTARIDGAVRRLDLPDEGSADAVEVAHRRLADEDEQW